MAANRRRLFNKLFLIFLLKILLLLYWCGVLVDRTDPGELRRGSSRKRAIGIAELHIDKRETPSFEQRLQWIREELPSFPLEELLQLNGGQHALECAPAPYLYDLDFYNDYWQETRVRNLSYHLFGAYYDKRKAVPRAPLVRLLTMINTRGKDPKEYPPTYCQLWYTFRQEPIVVPVIDHKVIWYWGGGGRLYFPTLLDCALPQDKMQHMVPSMVSLVAEPCAKASNILRVVNEQPKEQRTEELRRQPKNATPEPKPRFAICVKAMDFPYEDKSWRLIEWLETVQLLGAEKIIFYDAQMHPNMSRVLRHYMEQSPGLVELNRVSLARGEPHGPTHFQHYAMGVDWMNRVLNEMIPYNDCFYRNMYKFDYIGLFDIDELIMPLGNLTNWTELVEVAKFSSDDGKPPQAGCTNFVSYCFRNVYFPEFPEQPKHFSQLPDYYYMLQHVTRVREHCGRGDATKCLHSTKFAVGLHNHFALHWTGQVACGAKSVPIEYGQVQHYRQPDNLTRLIDPIVDDSIWRYQPELQERTEQKYKELGLLPSEEEAAAAWQRQREEDEQQLQLAMKQG